MQFEVASQYLIYSKAKSWCMKILDSLRMQKSERERNVELVGEREVMRRFPVKLSDELR